MEHLIMNRKEREQLVIFEKLKNREISQIEASLKLKISTRWVRQKIKRFYKSGAKGLVHKSRRGCSARRWSEEERKVALDLLANKWSGFGPTFATEKLLELKGIKVSKETLRSVMIEAGLWTRKKRRTKHRKRRERKSILGMMVQLDGSPHDWFEGRAPKCTLLVFIDDATSQILWLEFADGESNIAVMQATKNYVQKHGLPQSVYVDHGGVFHVNLNNPEGEKKTQWERAMSELGIEVIHAHSPQAKGRVERANGTMQDRLSKEMRLAGIDSIEMANKFIQKSGFIERHNQKYAVKAIQSGDSHRSILNYNLDQIFCFKHQRILGNDFTIIFQSRNFQLEARQKAVIRPKEKITVRVHLSGKISLSIRGIGLLFKELKSLPQKLSIPSKLRSLKPRKPHVNSQRWNSL